MGRIEYLSIGSALGEYSGQTTDGGQHHPCGYDFDFPTAFAVFFRFSLFDLLLFWHGVFSSSEESGLVGWFEDCIRFSFLSPR
jgi:hypothetical protein